jgi:Domain of unknown function (DUF4167)
MKQSYERYLALARAEAQNGNTVAAENYYQHAEHYFRLIAAAQEQFRQNQPQQQPRPDDVASEDGEDDGENYSNFGQEPGFVPQPNPPQPYMRDNSGRDPQRDNQQPYQRDNQPREHREREPRPQPQYAPQPQPAVADNGGVDRLPSFITGPQPQINGGYEGNNGGGERFPRRRRRPHGPRPEGIAQPAAAAPGEDFNPGNE